MNTATIQQPSLALRLMETRALGELCAFGWSYPFMSLAPRGDGHAVLVLPGFLASGRSTGPLRHTLKRQGYQGHRWKLGRNLGPVRVEVAHVMDRLQELRRRYGRRVSVIGWSLGGIYARELAWAAPDDVRQVITLGTPFRGHANTSAHRLFRVLNREQNGRIEKEVLARLHKPPPVPTTSIYSRGDGVVPWQCSLEINGPTTENIRVYGSHLGLGHNPAVLWAILDRLAQPVGEWRPFDRSLCRMMSFPKPDSLN